MLSPSLLLFSITLFQWFSNPYFLSARLNGEIYARFLKNKLSALLRDISLRERKELIFQHDGAFFAIYPKYFKQMQYLYRWMDRDNLIICPAWLPDFNLLDYFVWDYIKNLVVIQKLRYKKQSSQLSVRRK